MLLVGRLAVGKWVATGNRQESGGGRSSGSSRGRWCWRNGGEVMQEVVVLLLVNRSMTYNYPCRTASLIHRTGRKWREGCHVSEIQTILVFCHSCFAVLSGASVGSHCLVDWQANAAVIFASNAPVRVTSGIA